MKSKVYFTRIISPEKVLELYNRLGIELPGKVAVKVHSGEKGNQNFLRPEFWKPIIDHTGGVVVECNTAYEGMRNTTEKHMQLMKEHGWSDLYEVDILDSKKPDMMLHIKNGKHLLKNHVGQNLMRYDSLLVLSHFKGHPMGGFGGALKQLSIGIASGKGKALIHGVGNADNFWTSDHNSFLECMAESASSVVDFFKGNAVYINVMKNMSVDCDCCSVAEDPCMNDIGILASPDPVAVDKACLDLVYKSDDPGKYRMIERIESKNGVLTIEAAEKLGVGTTQYELIEL